MLPQDAQAMYESRALATKIGGVIALGNTPAEILMRQPDYQLSITRIDTLARRVFRLRHRFVLRHKSHFAAVRLEYV